MSNKNDEQEKKSWNIRNILKAIPREIQRNKALSSLIVTALIVVILLFPIPATAVSVSVAELSGKKVVKGEEYSFYLDMRIESFERVPVDEVKFTLSPTSPWDFYNFTNPGTTESKQYLKLQPLASLINTSQYAFGYWYGYGPIYGYGYGYSPIYGYGYATISGYGYGYYGYGGYTQTLRWKVTLLNTGQYTIGSYEIKAQIRSGSQWWIADPVSFYIVDYDLNVSPSIMSVTQGSSSTASVSITAYGQFNYTVSLSIQNVNVPTGVSISLSTSSISPGQTATLTVSAPSTAPTGIYTFKVIASTGGADGTVTDEEKRDVSVTLTITAPTPVVGVPPAPLVVTPPSKEEIVRSPEEAAGVLNALIAAGRVDEAADVLEEASELSVEAATRALLSMDMDAAAAVLEHIKEDVAANLLVQAVEMGREDVIANIVARMDAREAAEVFDVIAVVNPEAGALILAHVDAPTRARILAELSRLPSTPEKAAALLERMPTEKAVETIEYMVKLKLTKEAAEILAYLSDKKLAQIWAGLEEKYKEKLIPYMKAETLAKLKLLVKAKTANLVIIPAEVTKTVSYIEETGVEMAITATADTAGFVKTTQYVVNPHEEAALPEGVTLRKYIYVEALFPETTVSKITMSLHYTNTEVKGLLEFTLKIYKYDADTNAWIPVPTTIDEAGNKATITFKAGGVYALGGI